MATPNIGTPAQIHCTPEPMATTAPPQQDVTLDLPWQTIAIFVIQGVCCIGMLIHMSLHFWKRNRLIGELNRVIEENSDGTNVVTHWRHVWSTPDRIGPAYAAMLALVPLIYYLLGVVDVFWN